MVVGLAELLQELRKHGLSLAFCSLQVRGTQPRLAPRRVLLPLPRPGVSSAPQGRVCADGLSPAAFPARSALAAGSCREGAAASLLVAPSSSQAPSSQRGGGCSISEPGCGMRGGREGLHPLPWAGWEAHSPGEMGSGQQQAPPAQVSLPSGPRSPSPAVCRLRRIPAFLQPGGGR